MKYLSIAAIAVILVGCGALPLSPSKGQVDMQPPIGAPGEMPQTSTLAPHAERGTSWMLPEAKGDDLLYVAQTNQYNPSGGKVLVFDLKSGKPVGDLQQRQPKGACADRGGDVFIPNESPSEVVVYRHNGTVRRTLAVPYYSPLSCSVDPTSGNLAVTNTGGVAVYKDARGSPTTYHDRASFGALYCGYDDAGNLFIDGVNSSQAFVFGEVQKGGTNINTVTLNTSIGFPGQVQWDGKYVTIFGSNHEHY